VEREKNGGNGTLRSRVPYNVLVYRRVLSPESLKMYSVTHRKNRTISSLSLGEVRRAAPGQVIPECR
jgi:hypothetical protein